MGFGIKLISRNMGFDLGTANVVVYVDGRGIVLREPTMVAVRANARKQVLAVGEEAKKMLGRTPANITAVRPIHEGVVAEMESTQVMIKYLIHKANNFTVPIIRPRVVVCLPCNITAVERHAVETVVLAAGARSVHLVQVPMAAAIGAGLPVDKAEGSMVVDIGGGTSEVAVLSMDGVVTSNSVRVAGQKMDEAIINYVKSEYNLLIGERTAEEVKLNIGSAIPLKRRETVMVRGRDLITGLPHIIEISNEEVNLALREPLTAIITAVRNCLENTPPELSSDIMNRGVYLTGGGAMLSGLDVLVAQQTGMPVVLAENPMDCVAIGTGLLAGNLERLRHITRVREGI